MRAHGAWAAMPYIIGDGSFSPRRRSLAGNDLRSHRMDEETRQVYDAHAATISARMRQIEPGDFYALMQSFFHPGQSTIDIGCGSGRDVVWLQAHGYPAIGYDASPGMLREARAAYPAIDVREDSLPDLASVPDGACLNALCSAVLMHLPREDLIA